MKAICGTTASAYWAQHRLSRWSAPRASRAAELNSGAREFTASIVAKIHQLWPADEASLMDAMVLGEESFLRNATRTEFQRSGTYHVLVVSGMNLSILAFAIFWTLRQFRCGSGAGGDHHGLVSFAYAFVVGLGRRCGARRSCWRPIWVRDCCIASATCSTRSERPRWEC